MSNTDLDIAAIRSEFLSIIDRPLAEGIALQPNALGGVPALELTGITSDNVLLYLHGGGYMVGSARSGAPLAAQLATRANLRAYSLDYRLAPEHPFPAAVKDGVAAYAALLEQVEPDHLVIAGDSAGGGLAVATVLAARDRGLPMPAALVAFSGWFDLTVSGDSITSKEAVDPIFNAPDIQDYADVYLAGQDGTNAYASPLSADLGGLPPMLLQVGTYEVLLDDTTRLAQADVEVTLEVDAREPHVFQNTWLTSPAGDAALTRAADFIARHLPT